MRSLAATIDAHAARTPDAAAILHDERVLTWRQYAERSERLAGTFVARGLVPGSRLAVLLPDGAGVHVAYLAAEKAGLVVVGIGPRAGADEIRHLIRKTGATALLSAARLGSLDLEALAERLRADGLPLHTHLVVEGALDPGDPLLEADPPDRALRLGPRDLFFLNSTSGTTGLPKCVAHDQSRWMHFHDLAVAAGELVPRDVFLSALPAPFGFGLWTAHFTPALFGAPVYVMERFSPESLIEAIERHRVTVLAAVSTQFIMLLNSPQLAHRDMHSLRALFTGGEAVPYERAAEFEERTGATVLQFYGSNETGGLSRTTTRDTRERRLRTAGRVIESMHVRLFDETGRDVTETGRGIPACRGPLLSQGYYGDEAANAALYTDDGWMLMGDVVVLDREGYLTVIGRTADFIIRGGKNISGPAVEEAVATHPAVDLAAAVAMPDPVFGERVCVYVECRPGAALTLAELVRHLERRGVSKEWFPERLIVLDTLPRASGGKVAKQALREDIQRRLELEKGA